MRGPEYAAKLAATLIELELPGRIAALEDYYEVAPGVIPTPALVLPYDEPNLAVDQWPAVMVVAEEALGMTLAEVHQDGSESYRIRYRTRIYAYVRADGYREVDELRKRYVLAIREALLIYKSLTPAQTYGDGVYAQAVTGIAVDLNSVRESYSPTVEDGEGRTIASAYLDLTLTVEELVPGPPSRGTMLEHDLRPATLERGDTAVVPPHPAL